MSKRKLLSLACALSMTASCFAPLAVVHADGETTNEVPTVEFKAGSPTLTSSAVVNGDTATITLGFADVASGLQVNAAEAHIIFDNTKFEFTAGDNANVVDNGDGTSEYIFSWMATRAADYKAAPSGDLEAFTVKVLEDVVGTQTYSFVPTEDTLLSVWNEEAKSQTDYYVGDNDNWLNVQPVPNFNVKGADPTPSPKPTADPIPTVEKKAGSPTLTSTATVDGDTATITLGYADVASGLQVNAAEAHIIFDNTKFEFTAGDNANVVDNGDGTSEYIFSWMATRAADYKAAPSGDLEAFTVKVLDPAAYTQNYSFVPTEDTLLSVWNEEAKAQTDYYVGDNDNWLNVDPVPSFTIEVAEETTAPTAAAETTAPTTAAETTAPTAAAETAEPTKAPADPRPTPIAAATEAPSESAAPEATAAPSPDPIPTVEKKAGNPTMTSTATVNGDTATITLGYADVASGLQVNAAEAHIIFDNTKYEFTAGDNANVVDNGDGTSEYIFSWMATRAADYKAAPSGDLEAFTVKVLDPAAYTQNYSFVPTEDTLLSVWNEEAKAQTDYYVGDNDNWLNVDPVPSFTIEVAVETPAPTEAPEPTAEPTVKPEFVDKVDLDTLLDSDLADEAVKDGKTPYITIVDENGNTAEYGKDYVALDKDGKIVDPTVFQNDIWGYGDGSIADAIKKYTIVAYNPIKVRLNDGENVIDEGTVEEEAEPTAKPTSAPDENGVEFNQWSAKTVTVTKSNSKTSVVSFKGIPEGAKNVYVVFEVDDTTLVKLSNDKVNCDVTNGIARATVKVTGKKAKSDTAYVSADLYYTLDGVEYGPVSATTDLKVKTSNSSSSSSSSSGSGGSSGGNVIATPISNTSPIVDPGVVANVNFTDLGEAEWARDAVNFLASRGIVNGRSATTFEPNGYITRAEFAKLVVTVFGITPSEGIESAYQFADVSSGDWYTAYVMTAAHYGIVTGYPDGLFRPDALVSRQEMALMMYRACTTFSVNLPAINSPVQFTDGVADWAAAAVNALQVAGVVNGTSATTFGPEDASTRAQAAQMIYNLYAVVG